MAEQAWDFLELDLAADFALLQETIPISRSRDRFCVWQEIGGSRKWGSAVVSRKLPLTELPLKTNAYPGALTVAEADVLLAAEAVGLPDAPQRYFFSRSGRNAS